MARYFESHQARKYQKHNVLDLRNRSLGTFCRPGNSYRTTYDRGQVRCICVVQRYLYYRISLGVDSNINTGLIIALTTQNIVGFVCAPVPVTQRIGAWNSPPGLTRDNSYNTAKFISLDIIVSHVLDILPATCHYQHSVFA